MIIAGVVNRSLSEYLSFENKSLRQVISVVLPFPYLP